jgi:hypothetical protein
MTTRHDELPMTFRDPQLQKRFERGVSLVQGCPADQIPVCALFEARQFFQLAEGDESPRANEAIEHLLAPELRPALRSWYQRFGENMNPAAIEFRERLSQIAGEKFG